MEKKADISSVLIPDGESHFLNYVINCLAEIPHILIYIMISKKDAAIKYSKYAHNTSFYEKSSDLEWISNINSELEKHRIDVILPVSEQGVRALSLYRNHLVFPNKLVFLPDVSSLDITLNKWSFAQYLKRIGIAHPESTPLSLSNRPVETQFDNLSFPVMLKPITETGGGLGIQLFEDNESLQHFLNSTESTRDYIFQNYIKGVDFCCNVLCENGAILAYTTQKHTLHGSKKFAPQLVLQFVENPEILEIIKILMKSLKWSGVANVDLRYDVENKIYNVIEVNPRFWGSVEGSMLAGINFPRLYANCVIRQKVSETSYDKMEFLNPRGLISRIKSRPLYLFKWSEIWKQTPIRFIFRDYKFYLIRILRRMSKKLSFRSPSTRAH